MPAIRIELSETTHRALKARAAAHGHSTEAEVRAILDGAAGPGLSRNELLRRQTHEISRSQSHRSVKVEALRQSLSLSEDLLDEKTMRGAWE